MDNNELNNAMETKEMPMKWHKFLIYFNLWVSAISALASGMMMMTGAHYDGMADDVYYMFGAMKAVDIFFGLFSIGLAILAIVARFALARYQQRGPKLLMGLYGANAAMALLYAVVASTVTGIEIGELLEVGTVVSSLVWMVINRSYYGKRAHMFTN